MAVQFSRIVLVFAVVLSFGSATPSAGQGPPGEEAPPPVMEPQLVFLASAVEISGISPGGEVAVLTVWREQGGGGSEVNVRDDTLVDEDEDGVVVFELDRSVPELSIWVVVDVATGGREVMSPAAFEPRRRELRPGEFRAASQLATLDLSRVEVLMVRPGVGAFRARLGDGSEDDQDGAIDGRVALSAAQIVRPVRRPPEVEEPALPMRFLGRDVIVAVDPRTLDVAEVDVPAQPSGGAS